MQCKQQTPPSPHVSTPPHTEKHNLQADMERGEERKLSREEAVGGGQPHCPRCLRPRPRHRHRHAHPSRCRCHRPSALLPGIGAGGESGSRAAGNTTTAGRFSAPPPQCCCPLCPPLQLLDHQQRYVRHCNLTTTFLSSALSLRLRVEARRSQW
ncbi:hypothetical protein SORBI_3001G255700 [Sorghum bicolor]|uniref:Uncharacterized protein n=1 Tax=Sorghum bicolor TaxID=4558 RepID=A0A1B6QKZ0_SORBI|nr:hypothetical protein SORBI_3001G255700 [Sorghum bicolor]